MSIKEFNCIVEDLLKQTTGLIGTKYLFNFKTLIRLNSVLPIEKFTSTMLPYKHYINTKNSDFFMSQSINGYSYNNISTNDIIDLQKIFLNIDSESKENIWSILQALIVLCEDRLKMKQPVKQPNLMHCM